MAKRGEMRGTRPVVLVIEDDPADRCLAAQVFSATGWDAVCVGRDDWAATARAQPPSLVLVADDGPSIATLREAPGLEDAALVVWTRAGRAPGGEDDAVGKPCAPSALAALARRWRPEDPSAVLARLEAALGRAEIAAMTTRLRDQLRSALETGSAAEAHRIAGIAGMLGFADLGAAWLAVADGDTAALPTARIATRRALLAL